MTIKTMLAGACLLFLAAGAAAEPKAEEQVLSRWGDITVTGEDIERFLAFKRPGESVTDLLNSADILDQYIRNLLMVRALAHRAQEQGLGPDKAQMAWQLAHQRDTWQVEALQRHAIREAQDDMDWEAYAREVYMAEPEKFAKAGKLDAAHILVSVEDRSEEEALALARDIYQKAVSGEDFAELARQNSDDPTSAAKGGELGAFEARKMVPPFSAAVKELEQPGDISEPVKTRFGYHIIKLNNKGAQGKQPFAVVKGRIIKDLKKQIANQTTSHMLGTLRSDALEAERNEEAWAAFLAKHGVDNAASEAQPAADDKHDHKH